MFNSALKTLAAASIIAATSTAAFAAGSDHIFLGEGQEITTQVELSTVRASGNGTVDIYSFHKGVQGELLGSTDVHAGANKSVDINLNKAATTDVIAVLTVNGAAVDAVEIDNLR